MLGVVEPILVCWVDDVDGGGHIELVDGNHRLEAVGGGGAAPSRRSKADTTTSPGPWRRLRPTESATTPMRPHRCCDDEGHWAAGTAQRGRRGPPRGRGSGHRPAWRGEARDQAGAYGEARESVFARHEAQRSGDNLRTVQLRRQWGAQIVPEAWPVIQANACVNKTRFFKALAKVPAAAAARVH